jgi:hypothetical protein
MTIGEITGGMLRAARSLTGLSQQELADRAAISRPCLTTWEGSDAEIPIPTREPGGSWVIFRDAAALAAGAHVKLQHDVHIVGRWRR